MNDTTRDIRQKQFEIVMAKPLKKRLEGLFEMTDLSRKIIQNRIIAKNPEISEVELKVEMFKVFYQSEFDEHSLQQIADNIKQYWEKKIQLS
ncbi:MAG: hypothetical protein KAT16_10980 [Candidatus Heimdallarchaeota archaeon]|nr:hypothetical protein [Candidatus Heimdallarchaeota archaeon]